MQAVVFWGFGLGRREALSLSCFFGEFWHGHALLMPVHFCVDEGAPVSYLLPPPA